MFLRAESQPKPVRTTCPYCGVGCGVLATPRPDGSTAIAGDPAHPANYGRLCSKGSALGETLGLEERLLHPVAHGERVSWDAALDTIAQRFGQTVREHGPDAVAFYVSGQLLTEDYYVANKLMKGFIGSANIDTNSRLCMSSSVAGHVRAFGSDTVPNTYEDLEEADLVVLVGSNLAWCHPVLFQRIAAAKATRPAMRLVLIDPRRTATAELCDLHLGIAPDGDAPLFAGLLAFLADEGALDERYLADHTEGFDEALAAARHWTLPLLEARIGLPAADILAFFRLFEQTERVVTVYSQGVNQSAQGTDKVNAILNCHLATARIGKPGSGPFSVTGQPNAMGGREVGGLATMLAAHLDLADAGHRALVQGFWQSPSVPDRAGLKAVDLFRSVGEGRVKALWIMGTNPVVSMPDAGRVAEALAACPFVVVSEVCARGDTVDLAHIRLPAAAWGEKTGTVTNSERRVSRQRPFLALPGEARPDWWIVTEVARRMGFGAAFAYASPADIFAEHARLSAQGNGGTRDFDLGALAGLDASGYEALEPVQWPARQGAASGGRFFADGRFFHPNGRARLVPFREAGERAQALTLNTGRVRDHWHTMTRTGLSARLSAHVAEPFLEIHPDDAAAQGLRSGDIATVSAAHAGPGHRGATLLRCTVSARVRPGTVFAPMHWTGRFASQGRIGPVVEACVDPVSGQPALKSSAVRVARLAVRWQGFAVVRERPDLTLAEYVVAARAEGGWRVELAGTAPPDGAALAHALFGLSPDAPLVAYRDAGVGAERFAAWEGTRLLGALWIEAAGPARMSRPFALEQLAAPALSQRERAALLAGRGEAGRPDPGPIVCSCLRVGALDIGRAAKDGATSVELVGARTKAGTNCGSCRSEIRGILDKLRTPEPA